MSIGLTFALAGCGASVNHQASQAPAPAPTVPAPSPTPPTQVKPTPEQCDSERFTTREALFTQVDLAARQALIERVLQNLIPWERNQLQVFREVMENPQAKPGDRDWAIGQFRAGMAAVLQRLKMRPTGDICAAVAADDFGQTYIQVESRKSRISSVIRQEQGQAQVFRFALQWMPWDGIGQVVVSTSERRPNEPLMERGPWGIPNLSLDRGIEQSLWEYVEERISVDCRAKTSMSEAQKAAFGKVALRADLEP
jgi:hypothetical protein